MLCALLSLCSCAGTNIRDFEGSQPTLRLEEYFAGKTRGYGQIYSRFGTLRQQFTVDIDGYYEGKEFILDEFFVFQDGKKVTRKWRITKLDDNNYEARADDVEGVARGKTFGKAIQWSYNMSLEKFGSGSWQLKFDDWMFRQTDELLINRATMTKWGVGVSEMIIMFEKVR